MAQTGVGHRIANEAWGAAASWVITGETASERGVRPRNTFDPAQGQWGALQFVARYGSLKIDGDAFEFGLANTAASQHARAFTVGANWYPAGFVKMYVTFERTRFDGPVARPTENLILFRNQLAF